MKKRLTILYTLQKINSTRFWTIMFISSLICIHHVRYPWKACLFAFRLMPYLLGLFHWRVCRVSKLGAMSKMKSCQINLIVYEKCMSCFVFCFCERTYTHTHCPFIVPKSSETKHHAEFQIVVQLFFDIAPNIATLPRSCHAGNHVKLSINGRTNEQAFK